MNTPHDLNIPVTYNFNDLVNSRGVLVDFYSLITPLRVFICNPTSLLLWIRGMQVDVSPSITRHADTIRGGVATLSFGGSPRLVLPHKGRGGRERLAANWIYSFFIISYQRVMSATRSPAPRSRQREYSASLWTVRDRPVKPTGWAAVLAVQRVFLQYLANALSLQDLDLRKYRECVCPRNVKVL